MKSILLQAPERFACIERDPPAPEPGEAVVRIVAAGICASDVAVIRGSNPVARYPVVLGHESIGVVEEAPADAPVRPGEWVAIHPTVGCGDCPACRAGRVNQCPRCEVIGINRKGGFFSERTAVPVGQLYPVPPELQSERGVLVEPTAVGVQVNQRGGTQAGERALIIGAGVVGTMVAQVARAYGVADVVFVDRLESRREMLARLGFTKFVLADGGPLAEPVLAMGGPVDVVFDVVCTAATIEAGAAALRPGGRLVLIAVPHGTEPVAIPYATVYRRELSLIASRNYTRHAFAEAIRLVAAGAIDEDVMVTGRYPLADFAAAYTDLTGNPERHLKVLLRPDG